MSTFKINTRFMLRTMTKVNPVRLPGTLKSRRAKEAEVMFQSRND